MPVRVVEGAVQHYEWGHPDFIPTFLGVASKGRPWAELWLGTHPNGPTLLDDGTPLEALSGPLPYLLKILAAAKPLSLQAHPTPDQAAEGHERGVFADPHAKPELLVALTEFEALCGFRPPERTVELLRELGADELADVVESDGLSAALVGLYRGGIDASSVVAACADSQRPEAHWVRTLAERYPDDPSVAVTLLLNHVVLQPGEALHLGAGNLHGYLSGSGIELMQASDNVVRGGLTTKEVDVDLLLDTVDPTPLERPVMDAEDGRYPLPEAGVVLVTLRAGDGHTAVGHEMVIVDDGTTLYLSPGTQIFAESTTWVVTPHP